MWVFLTGSGEYVQSMEDVCCATLLFVWRIVDMVTMFIAIVPSSSFAGGV